MRIITLLLATLLSFTGYSQEGPCRWTKRGAPNTIDSSNQQTWLRAVQMPLVGRVSPCHDSTNLVYLSAGGTWYRHTGAGGGFVAISGGGGGSVIAGRYIIKSGDTISVDTSTLLAKSFASPNNWQAPTTAAVNGLLSEYATVDSLDSVAGLIPVGAVDSVTLADSMALKVPYTGATTNVNLGEYYIRGGAFVFDTTPTVTPFDGTMYWDNVNKTPQVQLNGEVTLQVGQELHVRARNNTGVTITNGSVVYINGALGNNPTIALADADSASTSEVVGVATEDIIANETGYVTAIGVVNGINTSGWNSGDRLYLSTTNGQLTNVPPTPPHISKLVATALNSTNNGRIFVMASNSLATDTTLSNGANIAPTTNAVKRYVISQGYGTGTIRAITGDLTASGTGTVTGTLATVNASPATYTNATVTVDSKGRVTSASSGTTPVTSVSGTSGRVSSTGGTTPVVDLVTVNATPATYGSATAIPVVTVDAYGRATTITTTNPSVTATNTATLTNKRITYRTGGAASYTTSVTIAADSVDMFVITAQTTALLFNAPSGTPTQGQMLLIRIKDNGTARALTWNAIWRSGTTVTLPTTTVLSRTLYMEFLYNENDTKWDIVGVANGY